MDAPEPERPTPRLVDLAHPIRDGMPAYPGLPPARVELLLSHEQSRERYRGQAEFALTSFALAGNTGTYLDSPYHRYRDGADVAGLPLEAVAAVPGMVVDAELQPGSAAIDLPVEATTLYGRALLVRSGWSRHWGTPAYWSGGPYLSAAAVALLVRGEPALVGVDFANVDDPEDSSRPAHTQLLGAGIVIVEHLTRLEQLPPHGFRFHCAPLALEGAASVPVRAYAEVLGPGASGA